MSFENGAQYGLEILKRELAYEKIKSKKIIIFGLNNSTKLCVYYLHSISISPIAIVYKDENQKKDRRHYSGISMCAPEEVLKDTDENVLVVITELMASEIERQILKMYPALEGKIISLYLQDRTMMFEPWKAEMGYKKVDLQAGQKEMLELMKQIHKFCEERDIKYVLTYGSLIGAIRHKGFIPWDDDMDIYMPWEDFLKFCKEIEKTKAFDYKCMFCESSKMQTITTLLQIVSDKVCSEYYNFPLRTSQGVTIDIWPLVTFPNDIDKQIEYEYELVEAGDEWKENVVMNFASERYNHDVHETMIQRIYDTMNKYSNEDSLYVGDAYCGFLTDPARVRRAFRKELCEERELAEFEDTKFWIPKGYDEILTSFYGDYMQLPKEENRMPITYLNLYMKEE